MYTANQAQALGIPLTGVGNLPLLPFGGKYLFVDSVNGSNGSNGESIQDAVATIAQAQTLATANKDVVVILPGHSETVTTAITLSKAGVQYIGIGQSLRKPSITGNAAIDAVTVTAANVVIDNIQFPAPSTDDQTADINVAAAGVVIRNTRHIGSTTSKNKTDIITVASGGDDLLVEGSRVFNTVVDCVSWLSLEAAVARPVIRNCVVQGAFSTAALMDEATATLAHISNNILKNTKAATAVIDFSTGNTTGVTENCFVSGRHTTIASNILEGTGMDFNQVYVVEQAAVNGLLHPDADAD